MKVAYEDIRLAPKGELAAELQAPLVEDIFDRPQTPLNSQPELSSDVATKPQLTPATATNQREDQLQDKALDELLSIDSDNSYTELPPLHRNFFLETQSLTSDMIQFLVLLHPQDTFVVKNN